jgi:hypothetical protein
MDSAGTTQTGAASEFSAGHLQMLADDPQQRRVTWHIHRMIMPIDVQGGHSPSIGGFYQPRTAAFQLRGVAEFGGRPISARHLRAAQPGKFYCTAKECSASRHASNSVNLSKTNSKLAVDYPHVSSQDFDERRSGILPAV